MSLLITNPNYSISEISQHVFRGHFARDPKLEQELDERRKKLMYDDIVYNLSFLLASIKLAREEIFINYTKWLFGLLCNLMKDLKKERIQESIILNFQILSEVISNNSQGLFNSDEVSKSKILLDKAITLLKNLNNDILFSADFTQGEHGEVRISFLSSLLEGDKKNSLRIISEARAQGMTIFDIYQNILGKTMVEIGELWYKNTFDISQEHYASSVTQTIMASFYDEIFNRPKKNNTLVSCAVGNELHEIGIRMVSDLFEFSGWDTYFLGAAVPKVSILKAIKDYKPKLLVVSVTMPVYLLECKEIIQSVKSEYPELKIAVGGQAFMENKNIWREWHVDFYSDSAEELVKWADGQF